MEPFQLSVEQVNFEEYDLSSTRDELDSFDNVVSYDSDLISGSSNLNRSLSPASTFTVEKLKHNHYNLECEAAPVFSDSSNRTEFDTETVLLDYFVKDGKQDNVIVNHELCKVHNFSHIRRNSASSDGNNSSGVNENLSLFRKQYDITPPLFNGEPLSSGFFIDVNLSEELSHQVIEDDLINSEKENIPFSFKSSKPGISDNICCENNPNTCNQKYFCQHSRGDKLQIVSDTRSDFERTGGRLNINIVEKILGKLTMSAKSDPQSPTIDDSDSFDAFTSTTDALSLQKSVVGSTSIAPAAPSEIASYLAHAEMLIKVKKASNSLNKDSLAALESIKTQKLKQQFPTITRSNMVENSEDEQWTGSKSDLINIKPDEMTITRDSKHTDFEDYVVPTDEIKQKLIAKAKANSRAAKKKQKKDASPVLVGINSLKKQAEVKNVVSSDKSSMSNIPNVQTFHDIVQPKPLNKPAVNTDFVTSVQDTGFEPIRSQTPELNYRDNEDNISVTIKDSGIDLQKIEETSLHDFPVTSSTPLKPTIDKPVYNVFSTSHFINSFPNFNKSAQVSTSNDVNVDQVLREKANLEGQIEMLQIETKNAVRDRSELQAQLAALRSQLKSQSQISSGNLKGQEALLMEIKVLKSRKEEIEHTVILVQNALEEKAQENFSLIEDLDTVKFKNNKFQEKLEEQRRQFDQKETSLQSLKLNMTQLKQDLNVAQHEKRHCDNEIRTVRNDIAALSKTKEWYQQQLLAAQEQKQELHKELNQLQTSSMQQNGNIEKLKSDNVLMKQQLSETQQRAFREKELLARHLETIETDMLEREAAFLQIQSEKSCTEENLNQKIMYVEDEKLKLGSLIANTADLEQKLCKTTSDLNEKQSHVDALQKEHAEMLKALTLSQQKLLQNENEFYALEAKFIDADARLKDFQGNFSGTEMLALKEEKIALEVALASVNEEKRAIDLALELLKDDMKKFEASFKIMRNDLSTRSSQLELVQIEKLELQKHVDEARNELKLQQMTFDEFNHSVSNKFTNVNELKEANIGLENDLKDIKKELELLKDNYERVSQDKLNAFELLNDAQTKVINYELQQHESFNELASLQAKCHSLESNESQYSSLTDQNSQLKSYINEMQSRVTVEITNYEQKIQQLSKELQNSQQELQQNHSKHLSEVNLVNSKLTEAENERKEVLAEMTDLQQKIAHGEIITKEGEHLKEQLQLMTNKVEALEQKKTALETEIDIQRDSARNEIQNYKERIAELEQHQREMQQILVQNTLTQNESRQLALDLEREKGRLAGVLQSHSALKQHTCELEGALAEKESSLVDISAMTQHQLNEMSQLANKHKTTIASLEESIYTEKENVKEMKKHISKEKLCNNKLKSQLEILKSDMDHLQIDYEQNTNKKEELQRKLDTSLLTEQSYCAELEALKTASRISQLELESLQRQLDQNNEKHPVIDAQIKDLNSQIGQKIKEVNINKEKCDLLTQRQLSEMENVQKMLKSSKDDGDKFRFELTQCKKEKYAYQAKLSEIKGVLSASLKSTDHGSVQPSVEINGETENSLEKYQSALSIIENILKEDSLPSYNSKPLAALQDCLSSLQSEMSNLQTQIDNHTAAVLSSNKSWKSVESQMQELKDICNSDTASTAGSSAEETVERLLAEELKTRKNVKVGAMFHV